MIHEAHQKVQAGHLKRIAYLYVRQSSLRQVFENTESTHRQYALKQRAVALGWALDQITVIDDDLGLSGASADNREGFQRLVTEVGMGRAGIVMGLEVSRLARNNVDWHRLLEICALTDTLILDEDGVYDPSHFNDRLLLGLKGSMSEAELHVLKARLIGGMINKARRGELQMRLPIGFIYDASGKVILDPDKRIQQSIKIFFQTFRRAGSAMATVKAFREQKILFPRRIHMGPRKGEVVWGEMEHSRALWVLHHPRYAGAFVYGRTRQRKRGVDVRYKKMPAAEWMALLRDAHHGYIAWEEFERNERQLKENCAAHGQERKKSPPREGPALLQGLVVCGVCGKRMTVRYEKRGRHGILPLYVCQRESINREGPPCQFIQGKNVDETVGALLLDVVHPMALEVTLAVEKELVSRFEEADALRRKAVEQTKYEADLARRRYMRVDPDNRLVADSLEAEWNEKLRIMTEAQEQYERKRVCDQTAMDDEKRPRILSLAGDFPALWRNPSTPDRERKRMVRLLIEDVTLTKGKNAITAGVRFRGGATRTMTVQRPLPYCKIRKTPAEVVSEVDKLLDHHIDSQIADILNQRGFRTGEGKPYNRLMVRRIRLTYHLKSRYDRLRERGMLTREEIAAQLNVCLATVKSWRWKGWLIAQAYDDKGNYLFEPLGDHAPVKNKWKKGRFSPSSLKVLPQVSQEVQYET
jgi:DNA invertase Pin-like site-specific DNA recombinase